ncbi:uncharacterized protein LOC135480373 [Liolophura sinensis]|uniref:uncharacterized protein LOC135480373 n=1 Tax=Liolophura sinensis TaxID=3198878 RepID=UPI00315978DC
MSTRSSSAPTMYSKVVDVISKAPDVRKDFEVHSILPWFRKKSQLFQKLKTDFLKDIIRNCRFITKQKDDVIIKQGDLGECFYIILGGKISIYILNKEDLDNQAPGMGEEAPIQELEEERVMKVTDRKQLGNFVCHLGAGEPFGEVALVSEDCVRTASIIAEDTTDLVVVDRALYNRSVRDVLAQEFEEKTNFIKATPLFSNWAPKYRKQLAMAMYKETFPYESWLVKQGENVENIYFIISGQVEVQIDPSSHPRQYPKLFPEEESEFGERITRKAERVRPPAEIQYSPKHKKRDNSRCIKVCYLGINASIGDTEVLMEMNTYLQSAICSEKTEVLVLEMKHYERLFVKRHPKTIDAMRRILEVKMAARLALSVNKDLPLLDNLVKKLRDINNPPPMKEKPKREIVTYHEAEKQFLNHKGPLIDMWGPGSVFYAIRLREKFKSRRRFHARPGGMRTRQNVPRGQPLQLAASRIALAQRGGNADGGVTTVTTIAAENKQISHDATETSMRNSEEINESTFGRLHDHLSQKSQTALGFYDNRDGRLSRAGSLGEGLDRHSTFMTESRLQARRFTSPDEELFLQSLEERMREWLVKSNPKGPVQVQQLRRMALQVRSDINYM